MTIKKEMRPSLFTPDVLKKLNEREMELDDGKFVEVKEKLRETLDR